METLVNKCRECGCTDLDCSQCMEKTGYPCYWAEEDLCSACDNQANKKTNKELQELLAQYPKTTRCICEYDGDSLGIDAKLSDDQKYIELEFNDEESVGTVRDLQKALKKFPNDLEVWHTDGKWGLVYPVDMPCSDYDGRDCLALFAYGEPQEVHRCTTCLKIEKWLNQ